ncbi:MAG: MBG domain-containing protein, partial [Bacteroidota bacterium]
IITNPGTLRLGEWRHLVMTYDGSNLNMYLDGALVGAASNVTISYADQQRFIIGGSCAGGYYETKSGFYGSIDDFGFWNRPLSQSEVVQLFSNSSLAAQQVTFNPIPSKSYGDIDQGLTATASSGLPIQFSSSDPNVLEVVSGNILRVKNAGTATITASQPGNASFQPASVSQTVTVSKAILAATADNKSKVYGDANPSLTITYSGFKNGETVAVIDAQPTSSTTATVTSNAGSYPITLAGGTDNNYILSLTSGTLTVNKAALTATADNKARPYGDANPALTITYTGFKNSETASVIDVPPVASTTATVTSNSGTYPITLTGGTDNNYNFTLTAGTLTVNKATLTATADNKVRLYGDANPALTITYSGFKNSETVSVIDAAPAIATTATVASNVGGYPITLSGGTDNNYNLTLTNGTLTVNKATLTATADNKSRSYGDANPVFTLTYTGFKNNETATVIDTPPTASTAATATSNAGTYAITVSGGLDNNYAFTPVSGTLTVNKALLTATANDQSRVYGDPNPALTITYAGFKNNETGSVIDTPPVAATTATVTSNAGTYPITVTGGLDNNYTLSNVNGTLTVNKATVTVIVNSASRSYGDPNPPFSASYSGFRNSETTAVLDTAPVIATTATTASNAGTYPITATGGADNNYLLSYSNGTLTIDKATLVVTADNKAKVYGDVNPAFTVSYNGFKNSETASVIDTPPVAATTATVTSNV